MAGLVLGVESVPDGLATGLLAGVNPVAGLYAYLFGMVGGALFSSTALMTVQGTGAMAVIVSDVDLGGFEDPDRALFTLSVLTGVVMVLAGLARLGRLLRFVSNSVMIGFISAVGLNIVLGQLDNFTGYQSEGDNRVEKALDLLFHITSVDIYTVLVGATTVALIVVLGRTRLGPLGLVVAVTVGSALTAGLDALNRSVALVGDLVNVPSGLPGLTFPVFGDVVSLLLPAMSLAFVGLVQGAGVSSGFPNDDGEPQNQSQDFVAQGAGNIVAGMFQGMPVGGSMSATSLVAAAGARSRLSLLLAAGVMAGVIVALGGIIEYVAMPALAGLLIYVGVGTIRPERMAAVARTGSVPLSVMTVTFVLTVVIPLQYAVLVGVGISVLLVVISQSSQLDTRRLVIHDDGRFEEVEPPATVPSGEVIVLVPYGALFFATASTLLEQMPTVTAGSTNSVVILRLRGVDEIGATMLDVMAGYATALTAVDSKLVVVTDNDRVLRQLRITGITDQIGADDVYRATSFLGETVRRARDDAVAWIASHEADDTGPQR